HELPPEFVRAELEAVFDDIGVDAAKTGMRFSAELIATVAEFLSGHPLPLVVDPVMVASSGARLLREDAVETLVARLFPLATVVTPNLSEAEALAGTAGSRGELAERIHERGAPAVIVTGGHGDEAVDHFFDGERHVVMNETANATLALGALPVMAHAREEVEEMVALAGALVLNIGTLSPHWVEAMLIAGKGANARDVPVVLDPVGAGATRYRTDAV